MVRISASHWPTSFATFLSHSAILPRHQIQLTHNSLNSPFTNLHTIRRRALQAIVVSRMLATMGLSTDCSTVRLEVRRSWGTRSEAFTSVYRALSKVTLYSGVTHRDKRQQWLRKLSEVSMDRGYYAGIGLAMRINGRSMNAELAVTEQGLTKLSDTIFIM